MSEDCRNCGSAMRPLDAEGLCPLCSGEDDEYYNWEEQDYADNRVVYEYDLEHLEQLAKREKM